MNIYVNRNIRVKSMHEWTSLLYSWFLFLLQKYQLFIQLKCRRKHGHHHIPTLHTVHISDLLLFIQINISLCVFFTFALSCIHRLETSDANSHSIRNKLAAKISDITTTNSSKQLALKKRPFLKERGKIPKGYSNSLPKISPT